jgi:hydrogenase large subunit
VGPLARMWVNGDYQNGISVIDRVAARALEAQKIANAMDGWLTELVAGGPVYAESPIPQTATGIGLTEAPRGALGHWIAVEDSRISRYQVVSPTSWNASPRDDAGQMGPIEQALVGTPVADLDQPIELLRVVHSFDPCLACSVHMVRAGEGAKRFAVTP